MEVQSNSASVSFVVDNESTAQALGSGDVPVLGTPKVVALCEEAAVAAISKSLDVGQTSVGTTISLEHLAPSAIGSTVVATAVLLSADRRSREFVVTVTMDDEVVASGRHTRFIVDRDRFLSEAEA